MEKYGELQLFVLKGPQCSCAGLFSIWSFAPRPEPRTHFQHHHRHHHHQTERDYVANGGWETFLSYEDCEKDILIGLLRLRKCTTEGTFRPELLEAGPTSIVRELHVYGTAVPMHSRDPTKVLTLVLFQSPQMFVEKFS